MINHLIGQIIKKRNPSVLGLDTRLEYLPHEWVRRFYSDDRLDMERAGRLIYEFNKSIIDETFDIIAAVKVQVAYYEMYGIPGIKAFYNTLQYAREKGLIVIADVKRNDIGATAEAYSTAYLGETSLGEGKSCRAFPADFITVNPYLGYDGIQPFIKDCKNYDKGLFVLVKTSNPSSGQLQDLEVDGRPVYDRIAENVCDWGSQFIGQWGYSDIGAVVGATYPEQMKRLREKYRKLFFLVPGYGAQGACGDDLAGAFDEKGLGAIINASRSVLCAYRQSPWKDRFVEMDFARAAREELIRMRDEILSSLEKSGSLSY